MPISNPDFPTPDGGAIDSRRLAQARSHSYSLLGQLFLEGVTERLWPYVQALPDLAAALPPPFSPDNAAATHHHLFAFNLFPYESIFLDSSGLLGGDVTQAAARAYEQVGFQVDAAAASPDHLGHELLYLAHLTAAEALAWQNHPLQRVAPWQERQYHFLENHLLRWLIPFTVALERAAEPFYHSLGQLTLALVADHYAELSSLHDMPLLAFVLPDETVALDEAQTGLRQIVHYLITPRASGLYLTRQGIEQLGRQLDLPRGFGTREEMMRSLWDAAAQYDQIMPLLYALKKQINEWQSAYDAVIFPALTPFIQPWQKCLHRTHLLLTDLTLKVAQETV